MARQRLGRLTVAATLAITLVAAACNDSDDSDSSSSGGSDLPECLTFADLYALSGPESEGVNNWADAQDLATELGSTTELPDSELSITAPGEESGTYGSYIEIALADIAATRLEEGAITEDQEETTRKDYNSSADDNVIIEGIAGADGSFGWVGFAFAHENAPRAPRRWRTARTRSPDRCSSTSTRPRRPAIRPWPRS
jgi:ABC-type phosphate transport system substrate-binding protein